MYANMYTGMCTDIYKFVTLRALEILSANNCYILVSWTVNLLNVISKPYALHCSEQGNGN